MKTTYAVALATLITTTACGGSGAMPSETSGTDAGTQAEMTTTTGGTDAGTKGTACTGTLEVDGRLSTTSFDIASTGTTSTDLLGNCWLTYENAGDYGVVQFEDATIGQVHLIMRNISSMSHDGTSFPLTDPPTHFSIVVAPDANTQCANEMGQIAKAPSASDPQGSVAITYGSHAKGDAFKADIAGPITCDGATYINVQLHLETVWQ